MIKKMRLISVLLVFVISISSCGVLSYSKKSNNNSNKNITRSSDEKKTIKQNSIDDSNSSYITIDELLYNDDQSSNNYSSERTVTIEKIDILEKCSRSYFETQKYFRNGKLYLARIKFENILENLEYLYEEEKVSDSLMLIDFIKDFQNDNNGSNYKPESNEIDIFDLYNILFSSLDFQNNLEIEDDNTLSTELTIEQVDNSNKNDYTKNSSLSIMQNNSEYLFVKEKIEGIIDISLYPKKDIQNFISNVYEAYQNYLQDKFSLQELYLRSSKYDNFIKKVIIKEKLKDIYGYLPAIMSSYYTGKNSGGLWQLDNTREYRRLRNDVAASSVIVLDKIMKQQQILKKTIKNINNKDKKIVSSIISSIVSDRNYKFSSINEFLKDKNIFFNSDFSDFLAIAIILENPDIHNLGSLKIANNTKHTNSYLKSYDKYKSSPKKYSKKIKKKRGKSKKNKKSSSSSNRSYIILKYKVQKGDFLQKIATLFKCTVKDIKRWNPKSTKNKNLYVGTVLYLRGYKFQTYKARRGDSIAKICSRYKMKMSNFMKINGLKKKTIYRGRTYYVRK